MIEIQELEYCKINVKYESDTETVQTKKSEVINKFKGRKIPGFRSNHATIESIKQHYRKEINEALKQELAEDAVQNVIFEKNIKPLGRPTFSYANIEESYLVSVNGESSLPKFKCEFSLHIQPDFELKAYKEFEIPKASGIIPAEELTQNMLQELRTRFGATRPYTQDDFVQDGDNVILDFKTSFNGEIVASLTGNGEMLNVGRINIPGFNESLYGMRPGDVREFDLNMPETYTEDLAGKTLHFEVKLNMGSKIEPAALNDELAVKIGVETFDKLMENARATSSARVKELEFTHNIDQIARRLIDAHDFKVPTWISVAEAQVNARNAGKNWDSINDEEKEKFVDMSEKSVKLSFILQRIRENEPDAQLTDEEVLNQARQNLTRYSPEPEKVLVDMMKNGHIGILFGRIKDEYTLGFIEKTCKFTE